MLKTLKLIVWGVSILIGKEDSSFCFPCYIPLESQINKRYNLEYVVLAFINALNHGIQIGQEKKKNRQVFF